MFLGENVFQSPWWLDAVAPGMWTYLDAGPINGYIGRLPLYRRHVLWYPAFEHPPFTQILGPMVVPASEQPNVVNLDVTLKTKLVDTIATHIPKRCIFNQVMDPDSIAPPVFFQHGFSLGVSFSYRMRYCSDEESTWKSFHQTTRNHVRRARRTHRVEIDQEPTRFADFYLENLHNQGKAPQASPAIVHRLLTAIAENNAGIGIYARRYDGMVVAGIYIIWDTRICYFRFSSRDLPNVTSGVMTLLLWEAIKISRRMKLAFDFDYLYSAPQFGAVTVPYWSIKRTPREVRVFKTLIGRM